MDYRFLLGKDFRLQRKTFRVSALCKVNGIPAVRAMPLGTEERTARLFPADRVVEYLVCDEQIELTDVSFAR